MCGFTLGLVCVLVSACCSDQPLADLEVELGCGLPAETLPEPSPFHALIDGRTIDVLSVVGPGTDFVFINPAIRLRGLPVSCEVEHPEPVRLVLRVTIRGEIRAEIDRSIEVDGVPDLPGSFEIRFEMVEIADSPGEVEDGDPIQINVSVQDGEARSVTQTWVGIADAIDWPPRPDCTHDGVSPQ